AWSSNPRPRRSRRTPAAAPRASSDASTRTTRPRPDRRGRGRGAAGTARPGPRCQGSSSYAPLAVLTADLTDEAVSAALHGGDPPRFGGVLAEHTAQLGHARVDGAGSHGFLEPPQHLEQSGAFDELILVHHEVLEQGQTLRSDDELPLAQPRP